MKPRSLTRLAFWENSLTQRHMSYQNLVKKGQEIPDGMNWTEEDSTERERQSVIARTGIMLATLKPIDSVQKVHRNATMT